jgi:hypothetical protein
LAEALGVDPAQPLQASCAITSPSNERHSCGFVMGNSEPDQSIRARAADLAAVGSRTGSGARVVLVLH